MAAFFVHEESIVRKIWGRGDTVLLIFAGSSAEFALNKAVDWLYFTGRLPADPLGRLFSTVRYAQEIVFAEQDGALAAIDRITAVHQGVEESRGARIPDDAYLDVLFMLIDYSIRSFELLERRLGEAEKAEVFDVFYRVGSRMGLRGLPGNYRDWKDRRAVNIAGNLVRSVFTPDLYERYRRSLGAFRYHLLLQAQVLLAPARVRRLIGLPSVPLLWPVLLLYKAGRRLRCERFIRDLLLPVKYKEQIAALDMLPG